MKGPRVSGPYLEYWDNNTNALFRPSLYTCHSSLFPLCGDYVPFKLFFARHVAASRVLDASASNEVR